METLFALKELVSRATGMMVCCLEQQDDQQTDKLSLTNT